MKIATKCMAKIAAAIGIILLLTPLSVSAVVLQPMQGRADQSFGSLVPAVSSADSFFYFSELTCRNNPMEGTDPYGLWVEDLVLGVPSLALGGVSLWQNIKEGNIGGSLVDVVGIVADAAAIALPVVPGGVGYSIKAARAVRALNRAETVANVGLATANAYEASQESDQLGVAVNSGQAVLQMGSSALGLRKARGLTEALSDNAGDATKVVGKLDGIQTPTYSQLELSFASRAVKSEAKDLTYLYQKVGMEGEHLKFGITKNPATRYTQEELVGGKLRIVGQGSRDEMLQLERKIHETLPIGPEEAQKFYIQKQVQKGLKPPPYGGG